MARKRPMDLNPSDSLLKFREKRKWQIALRRYVLEKNPCTFYAPYFGLDINNMRKWFEYQFKDGASWENFGEQWQFDHIIPVTYFNFSLEAELKMCWSFINIRVGHFQNNKDKGNRLDILAAKNYFKELHESTNYHLSLQLLNKINEIETSEIVGTKDQQGFIKEHWDYLNEIKNYTDFEFSLLNAGKTVEDVRKGLAFYQFPKNK
jgi:hypothetical protein